MFEVRQMDVFAGCSRLSRIGPLSFAFRSGLIVLASVRLVTTTFRGLGEVRVDHGPGYRVYFVQRGNEVVILLSGGDKGSQDRDIKRAIEMAKEV
jgi:hypothetical protein